MKLLLVATALLIAGCGTKEPLQSRLEDRTGVTVVTLDEPIVLARPTRMSTAARDYIYAGPVEVNRMGQRDRYLWFGFASSVDRARLASAALEAEALVLLLDGVPMSLPLARWEPTLETAPYAGTLPVRDSIAARVTLDQVERIGRAKQVAVQVSGADGQRATYRLWRRHRQGWDALVSSAPANP